MTVPTLSDEILFGRPMRWKIFVSSKVQVNPLKDEREAAVNAIESTALARAWCCALERSPAARSVGLAVATRRRAIEGRAPFSTSAQ